MPPLLSIAIAVFGSTLPYLDKVETAVSQATLTLEDSRCAAVLVDHEHAITAAHCILPGERRLTVTTLMQQEVDADVVEMEKSRDVAVLKLQEAVGARPLALAHDLPTPGTPIFFQGKEDQSAPQVAQVARLGPCPSLPGVPAALFTTLTGQKGDSGAPLVDGELRVVGLVHGGAVCNIATPSVEFVPAVSRARAGELQCFSP